MLRPLTLKLWFTATLLGSTLAVSLPGCQEAAPSQKVLTDVRTATVAVPGSPWGIAYAAQKDRAFITLTGLSVDGSTQFGNGTLGVLDTSIFPPTLLHQIPLPKAYQPPGTSAVAVAGIAQLALSPDARRVFIAADQGAIVVDAERAIASSSPDAVIGTLNGTTELQSPGDNAIAVIVTPDERYAMVNQEHGNGPASIANTSAITPGLVNVFQLHKSPVNGSIGTPVGSLTLGYNVGGSAVAPNGRYFYATSERYTPYGVRENITEPCSDLVPGFLSVIDLDQLESDPSTAHHVDIPAGYSPVRVRTSLDGRIVWVASRESNALLAYDAEKLSRASHESKNSTDALLATVQVGSSPVDFAFFRNETRIVTTDANRFQYPGGVTGLSIIDVEAALSGRGNSSMLGRIPTFMFPRDIAVSPDGKTILVSQYASGLVQAIDVETLP